MIRKVTLILFLTCGALHAGCCTCTDEYEDLTSRITNLISETTQLYNEQRKETEKLKKIAYREGYMLANEKKRAEVIAQAKAIDSAGFSYVMLRQKAERIGATAERMNMMVNGYRISNDDIGEILKEMK